MVITLQIPAKMCIRDRPHIVNEIRFDYFVRRYNVIVSSTTVVIHTIDVTEIRRRPAQGHSDEGQHQQ